VKFIAAPTLSFLEQLAHGPHADAIQHRAKFGVAADTRREAWTVGIAQRVDARIAVLSADLAIPVAAPVIKTRLASSRHSNQSPKSSFCLIGGTTLYAPRRSPLGHPC
jgi:hypothetical protein